jgi:hypothetical protein
MYRFVSSAIALSILMLSVATGAFAQTDSNWEPFPDRAWVLTSEYGVESVTFRASGYTDLSVLPQQVTFTLTGCPVSQPVSEKLDGLVLSELWIKPDGDKAFVTLKLSGLADGFGVNTAPASRAFPNSGSVIAGFTGLKLAAPASTSKVNSQSTVGSEYPDIAAPVVSDYELPEFETRYKYSDALVTLHTRGSSVRGVLEFLSLVGNVSIILDPYWDQAPTGTDRPPISGIGGGDNPNYGTGGGLDTGFNGLGSGSITCDMDNVPFDLALDLIITSAGLVYFDIG